MRQTKTGILLANLGTPDAPTPEAVKRYLKQFLSDRRVVDTPRLLWWPLLRGVIYRCVRRASRNSINLSGWMAVRRSWYIAANSNRRWPRGCQIRPSRWG